MTSNASGVVVVDDAPQESNAQQAPDADLDDGRGEAAVDAAAVGDAGGVLVAGGAVVMPLYAVGDDVEVYDEAGAQWMPATILSEAVGGGEGQQATIIYTVRAESGDVLQNMSPERLRCPIGEGELVEYCLAPGEPGPWTPAVVESRGPNSALDLRPESGGGLLQGVSPSLVRRRWAEGAGVSVYQGPLLPWRDAVVVGEAEGDTRGADGAPGAATVRVQYDGEDGTEDVPAHMLFAIQGEAI